MISDLFELLDDILNESISGDIDSVMADLRALSIQTGIDLDF